MSEDNGNVSNETENQSNVSSNSTSGKDDYVRLSAYEEVKTDMFKYKDKSKQAAAELNELKAQLKAIEEEKLKETQSYQELYEKAKQEREELEARYQQEQISNQNARKRAALKNELGNVRDEYLNHANLNAIEINDDGTISPDSVKAVANQFRQDHSVLIPTENSNQITNQAPASGQVVLNKPKSLSEMSFEEKRALLDANKK